METYDICITAVPTDSDTARTLADSLRRYRLPGGVTAGLNKGITSRQRSSTAP